MEKKSEQPIAKFFDGKRNVEILPPMEPDNKSGENGEEKINEIKTKWTINIPTVPLEVLTPEQIEKQKAGDFSKAGLLRPEQIEKRLTLSDWKLNPRDKEIFSHSGQLPAENLKKYLNPKLKESMEVIDVPEMKLKLVAFENTNEEKANLLANLIPAKGPIFYSDMLLSLYEKKETDNLAALDQAMASRNLDVSNAIFYRPLTKDEFNDLYSEKK